MADDLYASAPNPSSSQHPPPTTTTTTSTHFPLESDDISNLLHTLLHNSSSSSSAQLPPSSSRLSVLIPQQQQHPPPPISLENRRQCLGSGLFIQSPSGIESSPGINFSYLGEYIAEGAIASPVERIGDLDFDSEDNEASELPVNPAPPTGRGSSKRCRDAEVHNLSEKRRRQRINEKMKALQKLVPNSNKTDKASMLDEAIEYLKQLQLQVQLLLLIWITAAHVMGMKQLIIFMGLWKHMLTMRNGSTLHPFYLPGVVPTSQQPQMGAHFDEGNRMPSSRGTGSVPANREFHMQAIFDLSNQPGSSGQKKFLSRVTENNNLEHTFGLEPSTSAYYRPFNLSMLSKVKYCQLGTFSILRRNFAKIHHPVSLLRMKDGCVLKEMGTVETTRSNCKDNGKTAQVVQMSYG